MRVLLIAGDPATGKTTLEMNLRDAICGAWFTTDRFQLWHGPRETICFVGPTAKQFVRWQQPIMLPGADSLQPEVWDDLPQADVYVLHGATNCTTPGGAETLALAARASDLLILGLYSARRQRNMEKRQRLYGRRVSNGARAAQYAFDAGIQVCADERVIAVDTGDLAAFARGFLAALMFLCPQCELPAYQFDVNIVAAAVKRWHRERRGEV